MTKTIQLLRGTTAQNAAFTGASGEVTVDTQTHELRVHDSSTAGGHIIYTKSDVDTALSGKADVATTLSGYGITDGANTDLSNLTATGEAKFTAKANIDLSNLTSTGANIANWSSNVSNCITEIPQDIKLELNNGTLTLKAGSKVYVPNGAGVFDVITIASDITANTTFYDNTVPSVLYYDVNYGQLLNSPTNAVTSGSTQPSTSFTSYLWYDTANNIIKRYTVNTWVSGYSLPIAICSHDSSVWTSIDQVFNGFGYIGSTVFALPGVKGLIPDGRNADGTLKNIAFTVSNVLTETDTTGGNDDIYVVINSSGLYRKTKTIYTYNKEANLNIYNGGNDSTTPICWHSRTSGVISNFIPKQVFHAVDYSDTEFIAHQANTDLSNLTATGKGKLGPAVYHINGQMLNSSSDTVAGVGSADIYLYKNGIARIDFVIRINTAGSSSSNFSYGINRDLISYLNSNIPTITPVRGGCYSAYNSSGAWSRTTTEYGGAFELSNQFWMPGRVYTTDGAYGSWPASKWGVNEVLVGTVFGTYTV